MMRGTCRVIQRLPGPSLSILFSLLMMLIASSAMGDINRQAIEVSQAALGNEVRDMELIDTNGEVHRLADFHGAPLVVSIIFTACVHSCSVSTRHINRVVQVARNALGDASFNFLTIGFDYPVDTPEAMAHYARRHGVRDPNWHFMASRKPEELAQLMDDVGFIYQESSRGYDHTVQVTIIDQEGRVYRQVYGEIFNTPLLVEPMKDLVLGRPSPDDGLLTRVANRVRMFCTVYDAKGDRYYFDYSLFMGIFIGTVILGLALTWLGTEVIRYRRRRPA
jgi:protein SCO1